MKTPGPQQAVEQLKKKTYFTGFSCSSPNKLYCNECKPNIQQQQQQQHKALLADADGCSQQQSLQWTHAKPCGDLTNGSKIIKISLIAMTAPVGAAAASTSRGVCVCVCVCMYYVCVYVRICGSLYVCMYVCIMYVCMYVYVEVCLSVCMYVCMYILCVCMFMYVRKCVCMSVCM
jgi:hypothetical protein